MVGLQQGNLWIGRQHDDLEIVWQHLQDADAQLRLAGADRLQHVIAAAGAQAKPQAAGVQQLPHRAGEHVQEGALAGGEHDRSSRRRAGELAEEDRELVVELPREPCDRLTFGGEFQSAAFAAVQRATKCPGEVSYLDVQGRLGDVEFLGGAGEVAVLGEHCEGGQGLGGQPVVHNLEL